MATAERWIDSPAGCAIEAFVHRGGVELLERWEDDWRSLCSDAVDDQPFYQPEWIGAHIRAFTPKAKLVLVTVVADGRLSLILPLLEERAWFCGIPVRRLRAPVNGHSCRFDALRRRGPMGESAVNAAWEILSKTPGWDVLEFEGIPTDGTISALARVADADGYLTGLIPMSPNPYVSIPSGSTALNGVSIDDLPINKKLRSQLRGIRRDLASKGGLRLRQVSYADREALRRFYDLESAGWKGNSKTAIASSAQSLQFYNEIAEAAEKLGGLSIYMLESGDELLAAHFGLSYGGRYFSPKVAYDERYGKYAPGHLIVEEILRDCAERGIREYDITGQNEPWKRKWTDQTRGQCVQYIFNSRFRDRLAHWLRFRVRPVLKHMVGMALPPAARSSPLR
jgi:CelD/BcsL family acetyltransferase involved in cellulose biosynthesis